MAILGHEVTLVAITECGNCHADLLIREEVHAADSFICPHCKEEHVIEEVFMANREIDTEADSDAKVTAERFRFNC